MFALSYVLRQIHGYLITGPESRGGRVAATLFPGRAVPFCPGPSNVGEHGCRRTLMALVTAGVSVRGTPQPLLNVSVSLSVSVRHGESHCSLGRWLLMPRSSVCFPQSGPAPRGTLPLGGGGVQCEVTKSVARGEDPELFTAATARAASEDLIGQVTWQGETVASGQEGQGRRV